MYGESLIICDALYLNKSVEFFFYDIKCSRSEFIYYFFAVFGPMPFTAPEERYFSMEAAVVGTVLS